MLSRRSKSPPRMGIRLRRMSSLPTGFNASNAMKFKSLSLGAHVMRACLRILVKRGMRADRTIEGARQRIRFQGWLVPRPPRSTETIAVDAGPISTGERMWQQAQPFAQQAIDLLGREAIADLLQACRIGTAYIRMPLSSASKAMPLRASCCFAYS
jgi:hypothetical protein